MVSDLLLLLWKYLIKVDVGVSKALFQGWTSMGEALGCQALLRMFLKVLEWTGDGVVWIPLAGIMMGCPAQICFGGLSARKANQTLFLGMIVDLIFVGLAKFLIQRPRPIYNVDDMFHVSSLVKSVDSHSFPSGHTARAAMLAALPAFSGPMRDRLLSFERGDGVFVELWVWAAVLGMSRILLGRHHLIDVIAGLLFGVAEAYTACVIFGGLQD